MQRKGMAHLAPFQYFVLYSLLTLEELERADGQGKKLEQIDHDAQRLRRKAQLSLVRFCPVFINPRSSNILPHIISDAWFCLEESCPSLLEYEPVYVIFASPTWTLNSRHTPLLSTDHYLYLLIVKVPRRSHLPSSQGAMDSISWQVNRFLGSIKFLLVSYLPSREICKCT